MTDEAEVKDEALPGYALPVQARASSLGGYKTNFDPPKPAFSAIWLISFTDLMGIVLTFFVLLYTMSGLRMDEGLKPDGVDTAQEASKYAGASQEAGPEDTISLNRLDFNQSLNLGYLKTIMDDMSASTPVLQKSNVIEDNRNRRLIITLPQDLLFEQGQSDLTADGRKAVEALTAVLRNIRNGIEIVGHADPVQPSAGGQPNWDLSLSRALAVSGVMVAKGYNRPLPVKGYSSGLYESLDPGMSEDKRLAISRRVDIVINFHDGSAQQRFGIGR